MVAQGLCAGVAVVGDAERVFNTAAFGVTRQDEQGTPVTIDSRFDLASLTKVVATLPAVLTLIEHNVIALDHRVRRFYTQAGWFQEPSLADATVLQLLTHTAGLPAWRPIFAAASSREAALAQVLQASLEPPLNSLRYSDLGFMLLGAIVERAAGQSLDAFTREQVFTPLAMQATSFGPVDRADTAATEDCGWRGRVLHGEVHDENAYVLGGIAGHAGLFSTARDLSRYAQAWLKLETPFASTALLREAVSERARGRHAQERRGLGWQLQGPFACAGRGASETAFGHTGFTGTSLWLDPEQNWFSVLLTNRVHPTRETSVNIHDIRVRFHEAVTNSRAVQG